MRSPSGSMCQFDSCLRRRRRPQKPEGPRVRDGHDRDDGDATDGPDARPRPAARRELHSRPLLVELDDDERLPGPMGGRMPRRSAVVSTEAGTDVRRQADVVRVWAADAPDDVDEALGERHSPSRCKPVSSRRSGAKRREISGFSKRALRLFDPAGCCRSHNLRRRTASALQ